MALDEAILAAVGSGQSPPTLRLYGWQPPCLSLGYAQRSTDIDPARLATLGWSLVRRLSGGRAILHTDELTYSLTLPIDHPLAAGSVVDSYRRLSAALLSAVQRLGIDAETARHDPNRHGDFKAICFETPSDYEITAGGKKLIGSAQVRQSKAILQHGTLPLSGDVARICDGLLLADDAIREQARHSVRQQAVTLSDAAGRAISWDEAAAAVLTAFAEILKVRLTPGALSEAEWTHTEKLRRERYITPEWTQRR